MLSASRKEWDRKQKARPLLTGPRGTKDLPAYVAGACLALGLAANKIKRGSMELSPPDALPLRIRKSGESLRR